MDLFCKEISKNDDGIVITGFWELRNEVDTDCFPGLDHRSGTGSGMLNMLSSGTDIASFHISLDKRTH